MSQLGGDGGGWGWPFYLLKDAEFIFKIYITQLQSTVVVY